MYRKQKQVLKQEHKRYKRSRNNTIQFFLFREVKVVSDLTYSYPISTYYPFLWIRTYPLASKTYVSNKHYRSFCSYMRNGWVFLLITSIVIIISDADFCKWCCAKHMQMFFCWWCHFCVPQCIDTIFYRKLCATNFSNNINSEKKSFHYAHALVWYLM